MTDGDFKSMYIRQGQYWQIAYQKFLVARNSIKKDLQIYIFFGTWESFRDFQVNFLVLCMSIIALYQRSTWKRTSISQYISRSFFMQPRTSEKLNSPCLMYTLAIRSLIVLSKTLYKSIHFVLIYFILPIMKERQKM